MTKKPDPTKALLAALTMSEKQCKERGDALARISKKQKNAKDKAVFAALASIHRHLAFHYHAEEALVVVTASTVEWLGELSDKDLTTLKTDIEHIKTNALKELNAIKNKLEQSQVNKKSVLGMMNGIG